ncbi:hypothetical protein H2198_006302 [Neophaeococcomyces mojaviensis]|uniref:Uncharacterized protein n=1 Tax=Neophaeococcomyces mojaviensis TaxID=3383035 RepID=A0ACC3A3U0_9EURO|nr:hypothetical protein H2198_006302 [Knufia sp. JES_112]
MYDYSVPHWTPRDEAEFRCLYDEAGFGDQFMLNEENETPLDPEIFPPCPTFAIQHIGGVACDCAEHPYTSGVPARLGQVNQYDTRLDTMPLIPNDLQSSNDIASAAIVRKEKTREIHRIPRVEPISAPAKSSVTSTESVSNTSSATRSLHTEAGRRTIRTDSSSTSASDEPVVVCQTSKQIVPRIPTQDLVSPQSCQSSPSTSTRFPLDQCPSSPSNNGHAYGYSTLQDHANAHFGDTYHIHHHHSRDQCRNNFTCAASGGFAGGIVASAAMTTLQRHDSKASSSVASTISTVSSSITESFFRSSSSIKSAITDDDIELTEFDSLLKSQSIEEQIAGGTNMPCREMSSGLAVSNQFQATHESPCESTRSISPSAEILNEAWYLAPEPRKSLQRVNSISSLTSNEANYHPSLTYLTSPKYQLTNAVRKTQPVARILSQAITSNKSFTTTDCTCTVLLRAVENDQVPLVGKILSDSGIIAENCPSYIIANSQVITNPSDIAAMSKLMATQLLPRFSGYSECVRTIGVSALLVASWTGNSSLIRSLLEPGLTEYHDYLLRSGREALPVAAYHGRHEIVSLLLQAGFGGVNFALECALRNYKPTDAATIAFAYISPATTSDSHHTILKLLRAGAELDTFAPLSHVQAVAEVLLCHNDVHSAKVLLEENFHKFVRPAPQAPLLLNMLGVINCHLGRTTVAIDMHSRALCWLEGNNDQQEQYLSMYHLGIAHAQQGNDTTALEYLMPAAFGLFRLFGAQKLPCIEAVCDVINICEDANRFEDAATLIDLLVEDWQHQAEIHGVFPVPSSDVAQRAWLLGIHTLPSEELLALLENFIRIKERAAVEQSRSIAFKAWDTLNLMHPEPSLLDEPSYTKLKLLRALIRPADPG